jgi:hypothetical protein
MLDTQTDPQVTDPPDDQPGGNDATSTGPTPTADPPDDQPGGTT